MERPAIGDEVRFMSGKVAGVVDHVIADRFRLNLGEFSVWLSDDAIFTKMMNHITLACEPAGLPLYAPGRPQVKGTAPFDETRSQLRSLGVR